MPERDSLGVENMILPIYPRSLLDLGITDGFARIAISVDGTGKLTDVLPVAYSRRDFADSSMAAIRQWVFHPMKLHNEPVTACTEVTFNFQGTGVVVSLDSSTAIAAYLARTLNTEARAPCKFPDLDRIPTPVKCDAPVYARELYDHGVSGDAIVEFWIDEQGHVRMPAVISADFDELGALAANAVATWQFEPPTHNNRPVLTKARQTFHFRAQGSK